MNNGNNSSYFSGGGLICAEGEKFAGGIPANMPNGVNSINLTGENPVNLAAEQLQYGRGVTGMESAD
ncbi:hypothetical protein [Paenibacillus sp. A14]|uniref:hypothetical protein n=1 Tax=Paenibacillus sp. A14 TaxID=3119820 RepID=UPI002FE2631B